MSIRCGWHPVSRRPARGSRLNSQIFGVAPSIHERAPGVTNPVVHIAPRRQSLAPWIRFPFRGFGRSGIASDGQPLARPFVETAIQQFDVRMPEVVQEPEAPCRPHARLFVVDDNGAIVRDAPQRKLMFDHPQESSQRCLVCIDKAHAPKIKAQLPGCAPSQRLPRDACQSVEVWAASRASTGRRARLDRGGARGWQSPSDLTTRGYSIRRAHRRFDSPRGLLALGRWPLAGTSRDCTKIAILLRRDAFTRRRRCPRRCATDSRRSRAAMRDAN